MTDKEIRLQMAHTAMQCGVSPLKLEEYYNWVVRSKSDELDKVSVAEVAKHLRNPTRFLNRCEENGIKTVGQLLSVGRSDFQGMRFVGRKLCSAVEDVLEENFGITDW